MWNNWTNPTVDESRFWLAFSGLEVFSGKSKNHDLEKEKLVIFTLLNIITKR